MKYLIERLVQDALAALPAELRDAAMTSSPVIERTRDPAYGDFATNAALQLAYEFLGQDRGPAVSPEVSGKIAQINEELELEIRRQESLF